MVDAGSAGRRWRGTGAGLLILLAQPLGAEAVAQDLTVRVQDGQSLRDIAEAELGDPDLWTEILRANGLASPAEVRPGMELAIPKGEIAAADRALGRALAAIQQATEQGARLFARAQIEQGIARYDEGVARRKAGEWAGAAAAADEAREAAALALQLAAASRDAAAEARLTDREGSVEGRTPQELVWSDRERDAVLIEEEKLRTLSRSSAQITFRDESRLRLNANSQAVIRRMRTDPLSRSEEAKVSLVEGDFYALLSGKTERKTFELEVPEVETQVESRSFWVRHDGSGSKFTNYDDGVLRVAARGAEVALGRNEAALVRTGQQPGDKVDIHGPPVLSGPPDNGETVTAAVELRWQPVEEAVGYWLELALDQAFQRMELSRWGLRDTGFATDELEIGTYYWRIAALDKFGLPGERSPVWRFHVRIDQTPPFLSIATPPEDAVVTGSPVAVTGQTEPGALLRLDGQPVPVDDEGRFRADLQPGPAGEFLLEATDPAGNVTRRRRAYRHVPDEAAVLRFDEAIPRQAPRHFVTRRDVISLSGTTHAGARLLVQTAGQPLREAAYAGEDGRFTLNVPAMGGTTDYTIEVVQRSGSRSRENFSVSVDRDPPDLGLDLPPPAITSVEWLPVRGQATGAASLTLNGDPVRLIGDQFDRTATLVAGPNMFRLEAVDRVGNARVESFVVHLDQQPPELIGHRVTPEQVQAGGPVRVEVEARDAAGLRQAAPFRLRVGGTDYGDFLELSGDAGRYGATVLLPPEAAGAVSLREVEIEDYAGNKARFAFGR
ncbi:FecR domain-containing protein [Geminicoccus roseus]|uniref:FecR domain-containing protein n=1 Tax=Geminicoccus roseus TaxID=404900 RepID=UPI00041AA78E|nr:FecR domain-containing protein [Geminicoccus roseus]